MIIIKIDRIKSLRREDFYEKKHVKKN